MLVDWTKSLADLTSAASTGAPAMTDSNVNPTAHATGREAYVCPAMFFLLEEEQIIKQDICRTVTRLAQSRFSSVSLKWIRVSLPYWQPADRSVHRVSVEWSARASEDPADCPTQRPVLHLWQMSKTVTIRLTKELASWLEQASRQSGIPKGRIVREQLEKARDGGKEPSFMRLAGIVRGARDLSTRKGFSRS
jgi:hypothetical protein